MARRRPKDDVDDDDDVPTKKKKKKSRSREVDDDDAYDDADKVPSKNNAYTGMLAITLVAFIGAAVLLFLDSSEIEKATNIAAPSFNVPSLGASATAAPAN